MKMRMPSRLELMGLGWVLLTLVAIALALYGGGGVDSTDSPAARSGLALHVDHGTGCHYLVTWFGGITPRMRADGTQVCTGAEGVTRWNSSWDGHEEDLLLVDGNGSPLYSQAADRNAYLAAGLKRDGAGNR